MKLLKLIVPLAVVLALLIIALPASAQGPVFIKTTDGPATPKPMFVRTAGTNVDPFGGLPLITSSGLGSASKFGVGGQGVFLTPGGKPSTLSGDGTSPRKSIYVGGAWSESGSELPTCVTLKIPAGLSRWFKMDTWKNKKLQVWLDDELDAATSPSGAAVFGAADSYMWGQTPGGWWVQNSVSDQWGVVSQGLSGPFMEGFAMAIMDPNNMRPNYAYEPPNAALYTCSRGDGSYARCGQGIVPPGAGVGVSGIIGEGMIHSWAQYNPFQPSHLLWWEGHLDGWVHARVFNQMVWEGVVSVCSYRASWPE